MAKGLKIETGASTAQMAAVSGQAAPAGRNLRQEVLAIRDEAEVVGCFLRGMSGLAMNGGRSPAPGQPALIEVEARALEVVMSDLADRCRRVESAADAMELGLPL